MENLEMLGEQLTQLAELMEQREADGTMTEELREDMRGLIADVETLVRFADMVGASGTENNVVRDANGRMVIVDPAGNPVLPTMQVMTTQGAVEVAVAPMDWAAEAARHGYVLRDAGSGSREVFVEHSCGAMFAAALDELGEVPCPECGAA